MDEVVGVTCEACGERYAIELASVVDLGAEPLLRERLVRRTLNFARCVHCGDARAIDYSFVVLDPVGGQVILFVPDGGGSMAVDAAILRNVVSVYEGEDPQPYLRNQVQVGDWDDLVALLANRAAS